MGLTLAQAHMTNARSSFPPHSLSTLFPSTLLFHVGGPARIEWGHRLEEIRPWLALFRAARPLGAGSVHFDCLTRHIRRPVPPGATPMLRREGESNCDRRGNRCDCLGSALLACDPAQSVQVTFSSSP